MECLNQDLIELITSHLEFQDILILNTVNQFINSTLDNKFYYKIACNMYTPDFWDIAGKRSYIISKPLSLWKHEIIRIEQFQKMLEKIYSKRWNNNEFYNYWNYDTIYNRNLYIKSYNHIL